MKRILIAAFIYISIVVIIIMTVMMVENSIKKGGEPLISISPGTSDSNNEKLVKILKRDAEFNRSESKGLGSTAEYNKILSVMGEFFESIEYGEYDIAYSLLSEEYKSYKGLDTLEKFKEYAQVNEYDNTSCDLKSYSSEKVGKYTVYVCNVILFERKIEQEIINNEQLEEYLQSRPVRTDTVVMKMEDTDTCIISFEGLMSTRDLSSTLANESTGIEAYLTKEYCFTDKSTYVIKISSNYEEDVPINMAKIFDNITAKDAIGNTFWAEPIDSTIENEIYPGQEAELHIDINGNEKLRKLKFIFNAIYGEKTIEIEI